MTAAQYRASLTTLGLDHNSVARFLGFHPRQSYRYAKGERPVPASVAIALALCVHYNLFPEQASDLADAPLP